MPSGATANQLSFDLFSTTALATGFTLDAGGTSRPAPRAAFPPAPQAALRLEPRRVEAPIDTGGDFQLGVTLVVDDVLGGGEAHGLQLVAGRFEDVDFSGGELVAGGLVPVGPCARRKRVRGMKAEALLLYDLLPVKAGSEVVSLHYSPPPLSPPEKELPKPPREVPELEVEKAWLEGE